MRVREVGIVQRTCRRTDGGGKGGCASEMRRACNAPVAKPIVVEGGDACQREVESVQRTCNWTDSGRVCNRGRGDQQESLGTAEPSDR